MDRAAPTLDPTESPPKHHEFGYSEASPAPYGPGNESSIPCLAEIRMQLFVLLAFLQMLVLLCTSLFPPVREAAPLISSVSLLRAPAQNVWLTWNLLKPSGC